MPRMKCATLAVVRDIAQTTSPVVAAVAAPAVGQGKWNVNSPGVAKCVGARRPARRCPPQCRHRSPPGRRGCTVASLTSQLRVLTPLNMRACMQL